MSLPTPTAWICPVCGYIHYGPTPPEECPVCGAPGDSFEPYEEKKPESAANVTSHTVLIIGAGIAGVSAAEAARRTDPSVRVILLSAEQETPYYRMSLTRYLAGEVPVKDLPLHPPEWYSENGIELRIGCEAQAIYPSKREVLLDTGEHLTYDRLILAVGAHPFVPPFPGVDLKNVLTLRTRADADHLLQLTQPGSRVICIGGGILGLENAGALARRGAEVTVLEDQPWLLPRMLNEEASRVLDAHLAHLGFTARKGVKTQELTGSGTVTGVRLTSGEMLPADRVVITTGVRAVMNLAREAGLTVNQGIQVDDTLHTSDAAIFAAGDCAEHRGVLYGTWGPAQAQGTAAGANAAGGAVTFTGLPRSNKLKVLGVDLFSVGALTATDTADRMVVEMSDKRYTGFVFRENHLIGATFVGDARLAARAKKAVEERVDFSRLLGSTTTTAQVQEALERSV